MHEQDKAILQSLVSVAWADGNFDKREQQMLDALIESFGASDEETEEIRQYAAEKKTLEDIPLTELSFSDRRALLQHSVVLSWVDGNQDDDEVAFLEKLREKLSIPAEEAKPLIDAANERAKGLLKLLEDEG